VISRYSLVVAIALVVAACTPGSSTTTTTTTTVAPPTSATSSTSSSETTASTLPSGTEELPEALREVIARLIPVTEELRELTFLEPPTITVITTEELTARVIEQVEEDYEDVDADEALYKLLGLVPADFDLLDTIMALYGEQVAGYYDGDIKELVVTAREGAFSPMEEVTLVHELTHALTDQHHSFNEHFNALFDADKFDQGSAFQALIEGDASLTELIYAQQLSPEDQQRFLEEAFAVDTTVFDRTPKFMQDSLLFPYNEGIGFVQSLYEAGGFAIIDQAYVDPPVSTEQIIEPGDYGRDEPVMVPLEQNELAGYEVAYGSTWGELGFRLMFDQILGGADQAAEGWGGDSYDVFFNGADVVLVMVYQGDNPEDSDQLLTALTDYIEVGMGLADGTADGNGQSFGGDNYAFLSISGDQVIFIAAGDPAAGATARSWFPGF
jgi:hypothetical protein